MSKTTPDLENLYLFGRAPGEIITPGGLSLFVDPDMPNTIGMAASEYVEKYPGIMILGYGALRNFVHIALDGHMFTTSWDKAKDLKTFIKENLTNTEGFIVHQSDYGQYRVMGMTPIIHNYREYDGLDVFKRTLDLKPGMRLLFAETKKKVITPGQYRIACDNLFDAFTFHTTDDPRKVLVKVKSDAKIEERLWKEVAY